MIPAREFSAMSLKAKPKTTADAPAVAKIAPAIPLNPATCSVKRKTQIDQNHLKAFVRKMLIKGSPDFLPILFGKQP